MRYTVGWLVLFAAVLRSAVHANVTDDIERELGWHWVTEEDHLHVGMTSLARTKWKSTWDQGGPSVSPNGHPSLFYFYSRGTPRTNRGAEVFHQLHHALVQLGFDSVLEEGLDVYKTQYSRYADGYEGAKNLTQHDVAITTAISHSMDAYAGFFLTNYTGAPRELSYQTRVIKWQIGYSYPSMDYFLDSRHDMICDTYFLMDTFGCAKAAVLRAPPIPLFYDFYYKEAATSFRDKKERLILYDDDFFLDVKQLRLSADAVLVKLEGHTQEALIDLYKRAMVLIDLWLPGAETVNHEAALFDVCVFVSNEMNGKDPRDFPIAEEFKIGRVEGFGWDYEQMSDLINRAMDDYDEMITHFAEFKARALALPEMWINQVSKYFGDDVVFFSAISHDIEFDTVLGWLTSVSLNYPYATIELVVPDPIRFGMRFANALQLLKPQGFIKNLRVTHARDGFNKDGSWGITGTYPHSRQRTGVCVVDVRRILVGTDLVQYSQSSGYPGRHLPTDEFVDGPFTLDAVFCEPWHQFITGIQDPEIPREQNSYGVQWAGSFRYPDIPASVDESLCQEFHDMSKHYAWGTMSAYFTPDYKRWLGRLRQLCAGKWK